ncbi:MULTISPECIES: hypothetical protein [Methylobacterium]|jgi:hypothetical protein|uniref:hypothetical protein n=1 Tax=Methylobacterium TaxID=407 RepID=UPI0011CB9F1C|nr:MULTISPECIES: hypothetical protein [Methylobacterium]TXN65085.1 hypothetical protein FV228_16085 [Methylobacterium sp. WL18]GJE22343.1 hypothetical protein JHFBIEKO_2795 [Methylobacterium mesophilicum]
MTRDSDETRTEPSERLARISDALDLPISVFFGGGQDAAVAQGAADAGTAYLLALIAAYLKDAKPEARRSFLQSVEALIQAESR